MEKLKAILSNYLLFVIAFAFCLVGIIALALYFGRKNTKKSIYLYGMFIDYKTSQIWSLTLYIMQYLVLCYSLATKQELTIALGFICILLTLIGSLLNKKILNTIVNTLMEGVNLLIIYFGSLVNDLRVTVGDNKYLFLQISIMFAGLLFFTFTTFKYIREIRRKDELNAKN